MPKGRGLVAALLFVGWIPMSGASGEEMMKIYVRLGKTETGVASKLFEKQRGHTDFTYLDEREDGTFSMPKCSYGTSFQIEPPPSFVHPSAKPCRTEIIFEVYKKRYFDLLEAAIKFDDIEAIAGKLELGMLPKNFEQAKQNGDAALAAQVSNEIYARLSREPGLLDPEPFRVMALDAGQRAISPAGEPLAYDVHREAYVLSDTGVDAIETFQVEKGLNKTGKLDSKTLKALTGKSVNELLTKKVY